MIQTRSRQQHLGSRRQGRPPATSHDQLEEIGLRLFSERGYDETSVDDIARAAGIGRRTFFCYFPSKADLVWGDFDKTCEYFRRELNNSPAELPTMLAVHAAIVASHRIRPEEEATHRRRAQLILHSPSVVATSVNRYKQWRSVVADFIADRTGVSPDSLIPRSIAYSWMGFVLAAYEQWILQENANLQQLIDESFQLTVAEFDVTTEQCLERRIGVDGHEPG